MIIGNNGREGKAIRELGTIDIYSRSYRYMLTEGYEYGRPRVKLLPNRNARWDVRRKGKRTI